jgi:hypothetical protein
MSHASSASTTLCQGLARAFEDTAASARDRQGDGHVTHITLCFYGFDDLSGVVPESFVLVHDVASGASRVQCHHGRVDSSLCFFLHKEEVSYSDNNKNNINSHKNSSDNNVKSQENENVARLFGRALSSRAQNFCYSLQFDCDCDSHDMLLDLHTEALKTFKRTMWRDGGCRPSRGPKLDNNDLHATNQLPVGATITFLLYPFLLPRYFEITGRSWDSTRARTRPTPGPLTLQTW